MTYYVFIHYGIFSYFVQYNSSKYRRGWPQNWCWLKRYADIIKIYKYKLYIHKNFKLGKKIISTILKACTIIYFIILFNAIF